MAEYNDSGQLQRNYFNGMNDYSPTILRENTTNYYLYHDCLNSPQAITNESGVVEWNATYKAFGDVSISTNNIENNFRFPGQYYDEETGLHYNYFRYCDPGTGRYITPDPIGLEGGINLYVYVENNPIIYIDPLGLVCGSKWSDWAVSDAPGGFDFSDCCQDHDNCYEGEGECNNKNKEDCDDEFFKCMERKCRLRYLSSRKCHKEANKYWNAVNKFGNRSFMRARGK